MLQRSVTNVSFVFLDACCKFIYLDVTYVSHICCMFIWALRMCAKLFKCFRSMLQVCVSNISVVSDICYNVLSKYCIYCSGYAHMLQAYVLNISSSLDICCRKTSMLQVFHEAQTVPIGQVSVGGRSRASRRRSACSMTRASSRAQTSSSRTY
jgi:hypothetical protein